MSATLYDPFGTPTAMGAPTVDLAFQAMVTDPITGLTDMGARRYSAASGTFTSEDTVAGDLTAPVTLNRYTYANGSPIDVFDPDGHFGIPKFAKNIASNVAKVASRVYQAVRGVATSVGNAVRAAGGAARATAGSTIGSVRAAARSVQTAASSTLAEARAAAPSMRSFGTAVAELASRVDSTDVHTVLAVAGLVPGIGEVADGADAALYLLEGDTKNALISFAAMVPGIGVGATLGKASVRMGSDAAENLVGAAARRGPPVGDSPVPKQVNGAASSRSTGPQAKPFAMGIQDHLGAFAKTHGAETWKDLPTHVDWKQGVLGKLRDPDQRVLFNLDDVDVWGGVARASAGRGGATDWELLQLAGNEFPKLEFWKNGRLVEGPFK